MQVHPPRPRGSSQLLPLIACAALALGCSGEKTQPRLAITSFELVPSLLEGPGEVSVQWSTVGAETVALTLGGEPLDLGGLALSAGSLEVYVESSSIFELVASGRDGREVSARRAVTVESRAPVIGELRAPASVEADERGVAEVRLTWSGVGGAEALILESSSLAPISLDPSFAEGSIEVKIEEETRFTLIATNAHGEARAGALVKVLPAPRILRFEASRSLVGSGETTVLSWETSGTIGVELSIDGLAVAGVEPAQLEGSWEAVIPFDSTAELLAWSEAGTTLHRSLEVEVGAPWIERFAAAPAIAWVDDSMELGWSAPGASRIELRLEGGDEVCIFAEPAAAEAGGCLWSEPEVGEQLFVLEAENASGFVTASTSAVFARGPFVRTFHPTSPELTVGESTELVWEVLPDPDGNVPSLELTDARGAQLPVEGLQGGFELRLDEAGRHLFHLRARTSHPSSEEAVEVAEILVHPRPRIESFEASPPVFDDAEVEEVVLSWGVEGATSLVLREIIAAGERELFVASADEIGMGHFAIRPRASIRLRAVASNALGATASAELEVGVAPTEVVALWAEPEAITHGQEVVLHWITRSTDEVSLDIAAGSFLREEILAPLFEIGDDEATRLALSDCGAGLDVSGCGSFHFPGGFTFPFGGVERSEAWVSTQGVVSFGGWAGQGEPGAYQKLPTDVQRSWIHLAPFWSALGWDLEKHPEGNLHVALHREEEREALILHWADIGFRLSSYRSASLNFQVILWSDGSFEYRYGEMDTGGAPSQWAATATIGFQLPDQGAYDMIAYGGEIPLLAPPAHRSFRYRPAPALATSGSLRWSPYAIGETVTATLTATRGEASHASTLTIPVARQALLELDPPSLAPIAVGERGLFEWRTFHAESFSVEDEAGGIRCASTASEGACALEEDRQGLYRYFVRAHGAHGYVREQLLELWFFEPFSIRSFSAQAELVQLGDPLTLHWETENVSRIEILADGVEIHAAALTDDQGSFTIERFEENTEFTLRAFHASGLVVEERISVNLWDLAVEIGASALQVRPGELLTLDVEARRLDGGAAPALFGSLPMLEVPARFSDISGLEDATQLSISSTATSSAVNVQLPFPFSYMGANHELVRVFVDGYVSFLSTAGVTANNRRFPSALNVAERAVHLAPFWDDLHPRTHGQMHTLVLDEDTFVIQWSKMSMAFGSSNANPHDLNFQLVLRRGGGFEYRYGPMTPLEPPATSASCHPNTCVNEANGAAASIGYQWEEGSAGFTHHYGGLAPAAANLPFPDGLSQRSFAYVPVVGSTTIHLWPEHTAAYRFCTLSGNQPVCREVEVVAELEIVELHQATDEVGFGAHFDLSWTTVGGTSLEIWDEGSRVFHTDDPAVIDQGSVALFPTRNTSYRFELRAGSRVETRPLSVEVRRFSIEASAGVVMEPEEHVRISWNLQRFDSGVEVVVTAPMEEIFGAGYGEISSALGVGGEELVAAREDTRVVHHTFSGGFRFNYLGRSYASLQVAVDGYLSFDEGTLAGLSNNQALPTELGGNRSVHLAPFWEDLHTRVSGRVVAGPLDADTYAIQWERMSLRWGSADANESDLNFLVVLRRDGTFEYRFGVMQPGAPGSATDCYPASCVNESNGSSATIGYQDVSGTMGHLLHFGGTGRAAGQQPVAGGLSHRSWRFSPAGASGSVRVDPSSTTLYGICALEPVSGDAVCAPLIEVEAVWGLGALAVSPEVVPRGDAVSLSWSATNLDSLQILANGAEIAAYTAGSIPNPGLLSHQPEAATTYVFVARSEGREQRYERQVEIRGFALTASAPAATHLPGETIELTWSVTREEEGELHLITPMGEIDAGSGAPGAFVDVSGLAGAQQLVLSQGSSWVSLPFTFPYLGSSTTGVEVYENGYVSMEGPRRGSQRNHSLPSLHQRASGVQLAVFWDELASRGVGQIWTYTPDMDSFVIQWKGYSRADGSSATTRYDLNFQLVLWSDGSFEYRYGSMAPPPPPVESRFCLTPSCAFEAQGASATIGYQTRDGRFGSLLHLGKGEEPAEDPLLPAGAGDSSSFPFPGGLSHRSFRFIPGLSGSAAVVVGAREILSVCGIQGSYTACSQVELPTRARGGELTISELAIDPLPGDAQWFEVRNVGRRALDLEGFELWAGGRSHRIASPLPLLPGQFATFASAIPTSFTADRIFGEDLEFDPLFGSLEVRAGLATIASVSWDLGWTIPRGGSLGLDPRHQLGGLATNDDFHHWCPSGSGSPGALGLGCSHPLYDVDLSSPRPFLDIAATGTRFHEMETTNRIERLPTVFSMPFFGEATSRIWVSTNGMLSLSFLHPASVLGLGPPTTLPRAGSHADSLAGPLVAVYWDQLQCHRGSFDCRFYFEERTVDGSQVLILQWTNYRLVRRGTIEGSVTFQVQLWASGELVVAMGDWIYDEIMGSDAWENFRGQGAWVGIEARDPRDFVSALFRSPIELKGRSFHFIPKP